MSLKDCINRAVRAGLMDKDRAAMARQMFDENYDQARLNLGGDEALAKARTETIAAVRHMMAQMRREKLLQVSRARSILQSVEASKLDAGRVMEAHLDPDPGAVGIANVSKRRESIRGVFHNHMAEFLAKHRRDLLGRVREKAELHDVMRELHGENTGNASARELAKSWAETAEMARRMFNQAGGDIPKLDGWALPHSHDAIAVRAGGFDKWYAEIRQRLDVRRMRDYRTGNPFNEVTLEAAAREAYEGIATEGWSKRKPGSMYGQKLARRHQDHRFFVFKSADDWVAYHEKYGSGDVFSVMMGHLDGMARDISLLQILGPNPTATIRWMGDVVEKDLMHQASIGRIATDAPESKARGVRKRLDDMYDTFTGTNNAPINGKVARGFAGLRSTLQSAQLGAASLSALSDLGFARMAASHVGMKYNRVLSRHMSLLNPANVEDQKIAVRLGLIADNWSSLAVAQQRYLGEISGPEITQRLADFTMRVTGLSPWTQAGRWAFGMEFAGLMADNAGRRFRDLAPEIQRTFTKYGISSHDWELARTSPMLEHKGVKFLRAEGIKEEGTALKFLDMIHSETEFAVPSTSLKGRSMLIGEAKPGTIQGELIRSFAMYKNFSITLMMTHFRRALAMPTKYETGRYAVQLALSSALMGGMALQLKEVAKGRDPRAMFDMDNPGGMVKFWGAAMLQGGGLGIFGDFMFSQKNRFDKGLASTVAGPVFGFGGDLLGYVNDNAGKIIDGKETKIAAGAIDLAQRYAPGASIWYLRAGIQNLFFDEIRKLADPDTHDRLRRMERKYKRDYGQEMWMSRADDSVRAPDLTAIFGE